MENGEKLPYLGHDLSIRLQEDTINHIELTPFTYELTIKTKHLQSKTLIKDMLIAWLKERAREYFSQRLPHFAQKLNVKYKEFTLRSTLFGNRYWGFCEIELETINLNWRVICFRPDVIDYLIIHELAHLRVPDHSDRFWNVVAEVCPNFQILDRELVSRDFFPIEPEKFEYHIHEDKLNQQNRTLIPPTMPYQPEIRT